MLQSYIENWKNTGWFYNTQLRASCLPLGIYTPKGWHTCTENYCLPKSREICEGLCAKPCTMNNGSLGVCLAKTICDIEYYHTYIFWDSCDSSSLSCCPKIPDSRLEKFSAPPKEGIISKVRRRTQSPSREQPVFYVYDIPTVTYSSSRKYNHEGNTCKRSFSKLKIIKNYLRSTMSQEKLTNMCIISIERELASNINFENVIDEFVTKKARKMKF